MPVPVSIKEAARLMGVKPKEIRRRIKNGDLEGFVLLPQGYIPAGARSDGERPTALAVQTSPAPLPSPVSPDDDDEEGPDERDEEIRLLEGTVRTLQSELEAQRREVQELIRVLRTQQETPVKPAEPAKAPEPVMQEEPEAPAPPAEPSIDWGAYDEESEELRATMDRLQSLLQQLEIEEDETHEPASLASTPPSTSPPPPEPPPGPARDKRAPAAVQGRASTQAPSSLGSQVSGDALAKLREKLGVSREALAAASGLTWGFITEVERGRRKDPRSLQRVAEALDQAARRRKAQEEG